MSKSPPLKPLTTLSGRSYTGLSTPKDDADNLTFQSAMRRIQVCMLGAESLSQPLTEEQRDELYGRTLSELGSGRLGATVRRLSSDKSGASIEPSVWTAIPQGQFRKMTIDGRLPQKGYGQLYFSRRSVAAFETRIRNAAPYHFEYDRPRWRLFDACIWVATGGQQTSREQVADEDLWDQGAAKLFEALALQPSDGSGLCVSGISQSSGRRLELMPGEWDLAHTGWRELGNLVLFAQSNDPIRGSYITADFTPLRLPDPTYIELEIERDGLFRLFPPAAADGQRKPTAETSTHLTGDAKKRRNRRPTLQQKAVSEWYVAHNGLDVADMSDQRIADATSDWAGREENRETIRLGRDPLIDKSTVKLLRKKGLLP